MSPILNKNCDTIEEPWTSQIVVTTITWFISVSVIILQTGIQIFMLFRESRRSDVGSVRARTFSCELDNIWNFAH